MVIIGNSIYLAIDDNSMSDNNDPKIIKIRSVIENTFSALYIAEFCLKVSGLGFIMKQGSYLRDYWNWIDFMIIIQIFTGWILTSLGRSTSVRLNALRVFRILIPLKSLRTIEGLRILVVSLFHALPLLRDTFIILGFFILLYALAGLHFFNGIYKQKCFYTETG